MAEEQIFITDIQINQVRHLKDVHIELSKTERKHLILTGRNGSGKTSVVEALRNYLSLVHQARFTHFLQIKNNILEIEKSIERLTKALEEGPPNPYRVQEAISNLKRSIDSEEKSLQLYSLAVDVGVHRAQMLQDAFNTGKLLLAYFSARRLSSLTNAAGIVKVDLPKKVDLTQPVSRLFLQYIVNLKAQKSFAKDDNDIESVGKIDEWFNRFEKLLKRIYGDPDLVLSFDRKTLSFSIVQKDRTFDFTQLSDGFSAILNIVIELIARMEANEVDSLDMQGIVLIDEVETHLHVELQKQALPILTEVFPNIQFIVTTHSPFVINSLQNAVVYDLETQKRVEDLSAYAIDGIVEGYFENDKYSDEIKQKLARYEQLVLRDHVLLAENEEASALREYLADVSFKLAPELKTRFLEIELERRSR